MVSAVIFTACVEAWVDSFLVSSSPTLNGEDPAKPSNAVVGSGTEKFDAIACSGSADVTMRNCFPIVDTLACPATRFDSTNLA
jgi:hypothetical protein